MSLPEKMTVCTKCNREIPGDSVFCQGCRAKVSSAAVSAQPDEKIRQMFSQVDKWEFMNFYPVSNQNAPQMTEQQKQEELERRIQNAQDIAIAKRIAMTEVERKRKKIIRFVILGILSAIITAFTVKMALQGIHN